MGETELMRRILAEISQREDAMFWRQNTGVGQMRNGNIVRFSVPGASDIIGCYRGRAVAIEVKTDEGRQSKPQRAFEAAWVRAGGIYILARSIGDVTAALAAV